MKEEESTRSSSLTGEGEGPPEEEQAGGDHIPAENGQSSDQDNHQTSEALLASASSPSNETQNIDVNTANNGDIPDENRSNDADDFVHGFAASLPATLSSDRPEVHPSMSRGMSMSSFCSEPTDYKPPSFIIKKRQAKRNSIEMRKLPVDVLLQPAQDDVSVGASTYCDPYEPDVPQESASVSLLHKTCLNSHFSLRMQMMLSFGTVSTFTIIIVVAVSLTASVLTGDKVTDITLNTFDRLAQDIAGTTAHYLADDLTPRILPEDLVQILTEATRDRFAGYPVYQDDSKVPFRNIYDQRQPYYPLIGTPLPLDWQMENANVNESNYYEHVQDRLSWYDHSPTLDTSTASYFLQGMCDPSATKGSSRYFPNCTDGNNDISTGGVIAPTSTSAQIHRKASDLNPLLKSLYEYHQDVKNLGLYFSNSGAGATVVFPHYELNSTLTYTSQGCNWMLNNHPLDPTRTFATLQDFERCELGGLHTNGNELTTRMYNPMDRAFCRDLAMNPGQTLHWGPFEAAWSDQQWLMSIGKAVYDRITKEFIACVSVDFVLDSVEAILESSKVTPNSEVSVVRFHPEGHVVASTAWKRAMHNVNVADLDVGVTPDKYQELYELVDYQRDWEANETSEKYEQFLLYSDGYLVAAYPMPPIPETYDKDYEPKFLVLVSVDQEEFFEHSQQLKDSVDDTVEDVGRVMLIVGLVGLGMMVLIIFMVANALTFPLSYMNKVAAEILSHYGDTTDDEEAIEVDLKNLDAKCVPKTELDDIVKEFLKMVRNFSGSAMAKSTRDKVTEIENRFSLTDEFGDLYDSRSDIKFKYRYPSRKASLMLEQQLNWKGVIGARNHRLNCGRNVREPLEENSTMNRSHMSEGQSLRMRNTEERMRSPLFFWIVVLIVTPLLLTTITISVILMVNISQSFPDFVDQAKEHFVEEEKFALNTYVELRAGLTAAITERATRDLHVVTRYTNWILNRGLNLTDGFTELTSGMEECKGYGNLSECPYVLERTCDCTLDDPRDKCMGISEEDFQYDLATYSVESHDTQPDGDRFNTSFPEVSYSAPTTAWWYNQTELPGSNITPELSRHESTRDRMRSAAALPIPQLLVNYGRSLGIYVAYEDDGLHFGYNGCSETGITRRAKWYSSAANGAAELRPELCPLGKYGYDPRCRGWYHKGREANKGGNHSSLYTTPPYQFASTDVYAQSATSPLLDSKTGRHYGQALVDFVSQPILESLNQRNFALSGKGFPILITIETDNFGADTVIGPGQNASATAQPIKELVLPNDPDCEGACKASGFHKILEKMKSGKNGTDKFTRIGEDGSDETIYISYAPVEVKTFSPVDSSDFTRGVTKSQYLLYSLAFAEYEDSLLVTFNEIKADIDTQFYITLAVLCVTIVLSTCFVIYFSQEITVSMTEPMLQLLELVRTINQLNEGEDRPELPIDKQYGSREVLHVTYTMERLYKVIRSANTAFFAGDVETAYYVLKDALKLFKRLGNKKAIGVACNNLGNTLLAAYRTLESTKEKRICGFKKKEIIAKGTAYFHEAIQQGEKAYDDFYEREGWSPNCLDFMQHLSNRYFNRAMFLLTVKNDHDKPGEIEELGARDLQISRDMDVEIIDEGTQVGWNVRGIDKTFNVMLSRFKGHLSLLEMGHPDDFELEEWMFEAFQMVRKELKNRDTSSLFVDLAPAARMQQIELELMKYYVAVKDIPAAAKIGIRMLVEDEFTLPSALLEAVKVLQKYADDEDSGISDVVKGALDEYRRRVDVAVEEVNTARIQQAESMEKDRSEAFSMAFGLGIEASSREMREKRRTSLVHSGRGDITMEMF